MPGGTLYIDHDPDWPEKAHAAFLGALAYPPHEDEGRARAFCRAAVALALREKAMDRNWGWRKQHVQPGFFMIDPSKALKTFNAGLDVVKKKRMPAAEMAAIMLMDEAGGGVLSVRVDGRRPTVNMTSRYLARRDLGEGEEPSDGAVANVISRKWADSKPVMHLGLALRSVLLERFPFDAYPEGLNALALVSGDWIQRAVLATEFWRKSIVLSERISRVCDQDLCRVELRESAEVLSLT